MPIAWQPDPTSATASARNIRELREARGLTQQQIAKLAGLPRATWQHLESGAANPTLSVLHKVALALQVCVEELISPPRAACRFYAAGTLPTKTRGHVTVAQAPARRHPRRHDRAHGAAAARAPWPASPTPTARAST